MPTPTVAAAHTRTRSSGVSARSTRALSPAPTALGSDGTFALIGRWVVRPSEWRLRALSEAVREFVQREAETIVQWHVSPEFIVAAAQVLHERVAGSYGA